MIAFHLARILSAAATFTCLYLGQKKLGTEQVSSGFRLFTYAAAIFAAVFILEQLIHIFGRSSHSPVLPTRSDSGSFFLDRLNASPVVPGIDAKRCRILFATGLILLTGVGGWLRLHDLENIPPGFYYDEAAHGWVAHTLMEGKNYPLFVHETNTTQLISWVTSGWFLIFGESVVSLRSLTAAIGILGVLSVYIYGVRTSGLTLGFISALCLAFSRWHFGQSRIGWAENLLCVPALMLAIFFLIEGFDKGRRSTVISAVITAIGLYGYTGFRPIILLIALAQTYQFIRSRSRESLKQIIVFWIVFTTLMTPMIISVINDSYIFMKRTNELYLFRHLPPNEHFSGLLNNIKIHLWMFNYKGDSNARHNIPGRPMLPFWMAIFFVHGFLTVLSRLNRGPQFIELAAFLLFLIPGILAVEAPSCLRTIALTPIIYLWIGRSFIYLYEILSPVIKKPRAFIVMSLMFAAAFVQSAATEYTTYFRDYPVRFDVRTMFHTTLNLIAKKAKIMRHAGDQSLLYLYNADADEISFIIGTPKGRIKYELESVPCQLERNKDLTFFVYADRYDYLENLIYYFPENPIEPVADPATGQLLFFQSKATSTQVDELYGLNCEFHRRSIESGHPIQTTRLSEDDLISDRPLSFPDGAETAILRGAICLPGSTTLEMNFNSALKGSISIAGTEIFSSDGQVGINTRSMTMPGGILPVEISLDRPAPETRLSLQWRKTPDGEWTPISRQTLLFKGEPERGLRFYAYSRSDAEYTLKRTFVYPYLNIVTFNPPILYNEPCDRVIIKGKIATPIAGDYEIQLDIDPISEVRINSRVVFSKANPGRQTYQEKFNFEKGAQDFEIEINQKSKFDFVILKWKRPDMPTGADFQIIDSNNLMPAAALPGN